MEFPQRHQQQEKLQQESSESLQGMINQDGKKLQEEANSPTSEWVISIQQKLEKVRRENAASSWTNLSIYKIPCYLRDSSGNDKAYAPQIVSLGPYHHDKEQLRQMDSHKWRSLNRVLERTKHDIRLYLYSMKEIEQRARSYYDEGAISLRSNEFVEMLVLDGCFVLELFRGATEGFEKLGYSSNDPVFAMRGSTQSIQRDMIMLENQLPLFVLDRLLSLQLGELEDEKVPIATLALRFFDPLMPSSLRNFDSSFDQGGLHCLDILRRSLLQTGPQRRSNDHQDGDLHCLDVCRRSRLREHTQARPRRRSNDHKVAGKQHQQLIHCVTELKEAGIKFKRKETDRFWDIEYKHGTLWIPQLLIHDDTKSLFLNLIAFEQCHLGCSNDPDITSYVIFMDNLINSPEDVGYLHYCGIVEHCLGSDAEVADLFNRLCQEVVFDINNSYLSQLSKDVNRYCKHRWNTWCASLRHNYFSNPWTIISLVAAVVLLLLTFAQTYYSIYGYYRPAE